MKTKPYARNVQLSEKFQPVANPRQPKVKAGVPRLIETDADVRAGIQDLRRVCAVIRKMHDLAGDPPLRRQLSGFPGLARIVIGQQVSVASAAAIWTRLDAAVVPMTASDVLTKTDDDLRAAGLSRPKVRTLRAISHAVVGGLDLAALGGIDEGTAHAQLTAISGIGPWTADVYLMFCVGRADVFASGDLALQVAAQHAMDLEARPSPDALTEIAQRWRPWRAVAARLLWHYYAATKAAKSGAAKSGQPV